MHYEPIEPSVQIIGGSSLAAYRSLRLCQPLSQCSANRARSAALAVLWTSDRSIIRSLSV
jgi:hypothetical protein